MVDTADAQSRRLGVNQSSSVSGNVVPLADLSDRSQSLPDQRKMPALKFIIMGKRFSHDAKTGYEIKIGPVPIFIDTASIPNIISRPLLDRFQGQNSIELPEERLEESMELKPIGAPPVICETGVRLDLYDVDDKSPSKKRTRWSNILFVVVPDPEEVILIGQDTSRAHGLGFGLLPPSFSERLKGRLLAGYPPERLLRSTYNIRRSSYAPGRPSYTSSRSSRQASIDIIRISSWFPSQISNEDGSP
jgi:hypothetical protein